MPNQIREQYQEDEVPKAWIEAFTDSDYPRIAEDSLDEMDQLMSCFNKASH